MATREEAAFTQITNLHRCAANGADNRGQRRALCAALVAPSIRGAPASSACEANAENTTLPRLASLRRRERKRATSSCSMGTAEPRRAGPKPRTAVGLYAGVGARSLPWLQ